MIIIKSPDEAAATAAIERALQGQDDVEIFQSEDDEYTAEELMTMLAYNAKQTRVYVGRLERNTRRMEEDLRQMGRLLEPLATLATSIIVEQGDDAELLSTLRRERERKLAFEAAQNPPTLGGKTHERK